jgi:hypothetical protein
MKRVLKSIHQNKQAFSDAPLFAFLRDEGIPPLQRLSFYPGVAHFIVSLGDLSRRSFRQAPPALAPERFDVDGRACPPDSFQLLFRHEAPYHCRLSDRLAGLIRSARGVLRFAVLKAIEEASNVFLSLTAAVAQQVEHTTGVKLHYLRRLRVELAWEERPTVDQPILSRMQLGRQDEAAALGAVDEVFAAFTDWTTSVLCSARAEAADESNLQSGEWLVSPRALAS